VVAALFDSTSDRSNCTACVGKRHVGAETREIDVIAGFAGHVLFVEVNSRCDPVTSMPSWRRSRRAPVPPADLRHRKLIARLVPLLDESLARFSEKQWLIVMGLGRPPDGAKNQRARARGF